jgi:hypothetical protein
MTRKTTISMVKIMTDIEIDAMKELRETPLSCWALANEVFKARSIVLAVSLLV